MNLSIELFLWRRTEQQGRLPQYSRAEPEELINTVKTSDCKTLENPRHGKMKVKSP
jgi:hypothetical protein